MRRRDDRRRLQSEVSATTLNEANDTLRALRAASTSVPTRAAPPVLCPDRVALRSKELKETRELSRIAAVGEKKALLRSILEIQNVLRTNVVNDTKLDLFLATQRDFDASSVMWRSDFRDVKSDEVVVCLCVNVVCGYSYVCVYVCMRSICSSARTPTTR